MIQSFVRSFSFVRFRSFVFVRSFSFVRSFFIRSCYSTCRRIYSIFSMIPSTCRRIIRYQNIFKTQQRGMKIGRRIKLYERTRLCRLAVKRLVFWQTAADSFEVQSRSFPLPNHFSWKKQSAKGNTTTENILYSHSKHHKRKPAVCSRREMERLDVGCAYDAFTRNVFIQSISKNSNPNCWKIRGKVSTAVKIGLLLEMWPIIHGVYDARDGMRLWSNLRSLHSTTNRKKSSWWINRQASMSLAHWRCKSFALHSLTYSIRFAQYHFLGRNATTERIVKHRWRVRCIDCAKAKCSYARLCGIVDCIII